MTGLLVLIMSQNMTRLNPEKTSKPCYAGSKCTRKGQLYQPADDDDNGDDYENNMMIQDNYHWYCYNYHDHNPYYQLDYIHTWIT